MAKIEIGVKQAAEGDVVRYGVGYFSQLVASDVPEIED